MALGIMGGPKRISRPAGDSEGRFAMEHQTQPTTASPPQIVRLQDVCDRVQLSASTIKTGVKEGWFPRPLRIGNGRNGRARGWLAQEIDQFILDRAAARDAELLDRVIEHDGPLLDQMFEGAGEATTAPNPTPSQDSKKMLRPDLLVAIRDLEKRLDLGRVDRQTLRARHRCKGKGLGLGACRVSCLRGYHTALQKLTTEPCST